jgi:hypothetical protein
MISFLPRKTRKNIYEAVGLRADGSGFAVEILGRHTEAEALCLAQHYATLWDSAVKLYRVPYINTSSAGWAADEIECVARCESRRG